MLSATDSLSNQARNHELEALAITAELVVGFNITDRDDVRRVHAAVLDVLDQLGREPVRDRVIDLLGLGAE